MNTSIALPFLLGSVVLVMVGIAALLIIEDSRARAMSRRIDLVRGAVQPTMSRSALQSGLVEFLDRIGRSMRTKVLSTKDIADLQRSLAAAGHDPARGVPVFVGAKLLSLVLFPTCGFLYSVLSDYDLAGQAMAVALSLPVGMLAPNWAVGFLRRPYQKSLRRGIPDALDLMVVCAEAGLGLESAVERVAHELKLTNPPVGLEFSMLSHELRVLSDRRVALTNLGDRTGQAGFKRLAATLAQSLKYGTPLAQGLRVLSAEMRNERLIQYEERAARLPALLVLPMIMFILPCLFIVLIGPSIIQLSSFFGT